ncbi:hypothetical protein ACFP2T_07680 [Plantactinospora solaniradicis]|uniref:Uncharacterized protein n=1 Tax=Plantactinospora solaniradicis TaxID=1723736 RepID=A0ABW1K2U3_9ACTN
MDVEIILPQTPVALVPGTETRVRVELRNLSAAPVSVRLTVLASRAGAWARIDEPTVVLAPGDTSTVDIGLRPPAEVPPAATVLPFTVQADDLRAGVPAGRATGLVTVTAPRRLDATLSREADRRGGVPYVLSLVNQADTALSLRLDARLFPAGRVQVEPGVLSIPGGQGATARLQVRPRTALVGSPTRYVLSVTCHDADAEDRVPALATVEQDDSAAPRLGRRPAAVLVTVLLVLVAGAAVLLGGRIDLPGRGSEQAVATAAPATPVTRPYALVDVFPQQDGEGGRTAAEAALTRLTAAGMPVRLVDSTTSDVVADGQGGLWVLLQDGLDTVDATRAYCDRYRAVAPKCDVVS